MSLQEFAAGHIKGALNLDSSAFADSSLVDKLVEQLAPKSQVVVHCAKRYGSWLFSMHL